MKVSYGERLATQTDPESCAGAGNRGGEALTGERAGRVLSREIAQGRRGADGVLEYGRRYRLQRMLMMQKNPARSETPGMHGNIRNGNWEILRSSVKADRVGKSKDARR